MRSSDILIVDDEAGIRDLLSEILQDEGYTVTLAENAEEARQLRQQTRPAMVLLDIWMPDCDGVTLLKEWANNGQLNMPVVMMSGHASIDTAVEATKIGALDFLEKPIALQKLLSAVDRALKHGRMNAAAVMELDKLGNSPCIRELNRQIEAAAKQPGHILLRGEPGSPFETVAAYFCQGNAGWLKPEKTEHIADMPIELLEKAAGGVLYVGDIAHLGKNIRNGIAFLMGKADRYNVRVVAADSGKSEEGADAVFPAVRLTVLNIPPLRQQPDDIPFLVGKIADGTAEKQQTGPVSFTPDALAKLRQFTWPGNFGQLEEYITRLVVEAEGGEIQAGEVAAILGQKENRTVVSDGICGFDFDQPLRDLREEVERRYFEYHISREGFNMSQVSQKVGLERTHLYRKLKQLGISIPKKGGERQDEE